MMLTDITNYLPLSERLATAGQPTAAQIAEIAAAGYQVVINLALHDGDYALADEAGAVRAAGMEYIHIPVQWERPTRADLLRFFEVMDAHRDERVFVHCAMNMRVSVFVALYRVLRLGWEPARAMQDVARIWQPNETWAGFIEEMSTNPGSSLGMKMA
jgi:uncharacterized protein (TIGR01244 family)